MSRSQPSYLKPTLIIGSSSRWRRAIVEEHFGSLFSIECISPDVDEKSIRDSDAEVLVRLLSVAKADAVRAKAIPLLRERNIPVAYIVCGDQVVRFDNTIREKPTSVEENISFLQSYRNRYLETVTGLMVERIELAGEDDVYGSNAHDDAGRTSRVHSDTHMVRAMDVQVDRVHFGPLPDSVIQEVVAKGDTLHTCGGFVIEDPLLTPYLQIGSAAAGPSEKAVKVGAASLVHPVWHVDPQQSGIMGFPVDMFRRLIGQVQCEKRNI